MIIQPGPGSCSSLIADELESSGLWAACLEASSAGEMAQIAKLALAAILIDTSNLTAKGKVTDIDVRSVEFLRTFVDSAHGEWEMETFYEQILDAKKNSLDLLKFEEILDRDYKDWTETTRSSKTSIKLGFCSSVKPIRWLIQKAGGCHEFLERTKKFANADDKQLDLVVVMSSFTSAGDKFSRELFMGAAGQESVAIDGINAFIKQDSSELGLENWTSVDKEEIHLDDSEIRSYLDGEAGLWSRLWLQTNSTASRKQVAPMLRSAVAKL
jgi:exopolyphosphatase